MPRQTAIATVPRRLVLAGCLPLILLFPQMAIAEEAAPAAESHAAAAPAERSAALSPEHHEVQQGTVLTVFFAFDRAWLTAESRRAIDAIAPRLRAHLAEGGQVRIEGHADATGAPVYNLGLSERRARAVARYLRDAWEIPLPRLRLRAWGESDLRRPDAPRHAENRRVEIALFKGRMPPARGLSLRPHTGGYLDIDDFGSAPNPLPGAGGIITAPAPIAHHR